jgi:hypothetical protein
MEAKCLLRIIPITILAEWVKGHYTGKDKEYKHDLNTMADSLATSYQRTPHPPLTPRSQTVAPPNFGARILHDGSTITNKLHPIMARALHRQNIISHILKKTKTKWMESTFNLIHWDAHEMAFK